MALKLLPSQSEDPLVQALMERLEPIVNELVDRRMSEQQPRWITPTEAGAVLGIKPEAVKWRLRQGRLAGRLYGNRWYVDGKALDAAIAESPATLPRNQLGLTPEQHRGRAAPKRPRP